MTLVSYTMVSEYQTCKRSFFYKFGLGLTPAEESDAIDTGVSGHDLLEIFYKGIKDGLSKKEAKDKVQDLALLDSHKSSNLIVAWTLVNNYIDELDMKGSVAFVEEPLIAPVAPDFDLSIGFTPDLGWLYKDKRLDFEDYKFVGRAWSKNKLIRYSQLKVYIALGRKMGLDVDRGILRFFNTSTGKPKHQLYTPSQAELDNVFADFMTTAFEVQEFIDLPVAEQRAKAIRTFNYQTCQWCDFAYPCQLEQEDKDASKTLATQYKQNTRGSIELIKNKDSQ